jgi:hypothetical protein
LYLRYEQHLAGTLALSLQRQAKTAGRTTAEYLRLYALEGFLLRLAHSPHRNRLVLKGDVLLAAYEMRRPTADFAALQTSNDVATIRRLVTDVASRALPAELDDCLIFDLDDVTAEAMARLRRHLPAHQPLRVPGGARAASAAGRCRPSAHRTHRTR